jgi:hypothetical protein
VLSAILTATARHRRVVLATAVVVAGAWTTTSAVVVQPPSVAIVVLFHGAFLLALVAGLLATRRVRPAAFTVDARRPAFRTPPGATQVFIALMLTFFGAARVPELFSPDAADPRGLDNADWLLLTAWTVWVAATVSGAWRILGAELRPTGLRVRHLFGVLTVPWEALAPGYPLRPDLRFRRLALTYTRPDLVRRWGILSRRLVPIDNVHAWFIADAIRYYVAHHEHRANIGTQAEYERLLHTLTHPPAVPSPEQTPAT